MPAAMSWSRLLLVSLALVAALPVPPAMAGPPGGFLVAEAIEAASARQVSTLAGGEVGNADGTGASACFERPNSLVVDAAGNVFVADPGPGRIRKVTPAGEVTTIAGDDMQAGDADSGLVKLYTPTCLCLDARGNLYAVSGNGIFRVAPDRTVTVVIDGERTGFHSPEGMVMDAQGNFYVADTGNNRICKVSPDGTVTTLAGAEASGHADGPGTSARFNRPGGIARDAQGNLYVSDRVGARIRRITPAGLVSTVAGTGEWGLKDGDAKNAKFSSPAGLAVDAAGNVFVADSSNNVIRRITPAGKPYGGSEDGVGSAARFQGPEGLALDTQGRLYVADTANHRIRIIK